MNDDATFLAEATALAERSRGHTRPNPPVGAVVVRAGRIIGRGRHKRCGANHAEVEALHDARGKLRRAGKSESLVGTSVYCTLEPCSKPGRVGACTQALIEAGVKRVVWAVQDPNPKNRGRAKRILARAGIQAECVPFAQAEALIRPFAKHVTTGIPYVTVKLALSLDGRIADDWGNAKWISSARARRTTDRLRAHADAVMVGAQTVRADDPSLLCHTTRNDDLWRVIISKSGRLPTHAQCLTDAAAARTLVYRNPREALQDLGKRGFMHVLCEGGLELARSLAAEGLVDEWLTVLVPKVIGHQPLAQAQFITRTSILEDMGK